MRNYVRIEASAKFAGLSARTLIQYRDRARTTFLSRT